MRTQNYPEWLRRICLASALMLPTSLGFSQATAPGAEPAEDEDLIELSPFTVEASEDVGYVATSSLAGTRIKSDLKNIANSITVVTEEFMRDTNTTSAVDLLPYVGNAESGGVQGNYSGASVGTGTTHTGTIRQPQNNNRVRGLDRADLTRDYFPTTMTFDSYNTSRVEINRGPNAILFGLGSPGGIINNQLIRPRMDNAMSFEFNYGSFGSHRTVFDVDAELVPEMLGLRVAGLYEDQKFQQNFAHEKDTRLFASAVFKPFKNANLRASYEKGSIDANRPRGNSPRDTLTRWWDPAFDQVTHDPANVDFNQVDRDIIRAPGSWFYQPALIFESNDSAEVARQMYGWNRHVGIPKSPTDSRPYEANMVSITIGRQWFSSNTAAEQGIEYGSFYGDDEIGDLSIFDWRNHLIDGPNKREWEDFEVFNVSYDQTWDYGLGSFGFEASYVSEDHTRNYRDMFTSIRGNTINIDINTTLPWGDPNPNFGRPFMAADNQRNTFHAERENLRLTAFLELDFAGKTDNIFKWLGRHNLTGYYSDYSVSDENLNASNRTSLEWVQYARRNTSTPNQWNSGDGQLRTVVYLGPRLDFLTSPSGIGLTGLQTKLDPTVETTGYLWDTDNLNYRQMNVAGIDVSGDDNFYNFVSGGSLSKQKIESWAFVDQIYLLPDEWLVGTLGWRHDKVEDFRTNVTNAVRDQYNFVDINSPNWVLPEEPGSVFEEDIFSYGIVAHMPPFIRLPGGMDFSVHYSKAENFQPADARINVFGDPIQPPGGQTEDYGFSVSLFDSKLNARFNWYESSQDRATQGVSAFIYGETDARVVRYNSPEALAAAGWQGPPQFFKDLTDWQVLESTGTDSGYTVQYSRPGNLTDTTSTSSKGMELDLTYNPLPNWRIAMNVAKQTAAKSNIAPNTQEYLPYRLDEWLNPPTGLLISDESGEPVNVRIQGTLNGFNSLLAGEGQAVSELREWRVNLITNYAFSSDSMFKGWNVGGAFRWQDDIGIGYPIITVPQDDGSIDIPDLSSPYRGPSETRVDAWVGYTTMILEDRVTLRFQLNVRNLMDQKDIVPVSAQPDGSIQSWFAPQGRTFNLRTVFEF